MKQKYICILITLIKDNNLIEDLDKPHTCSEMNIYQKKNPTNMNFGMIIFHFLSKLMIMFNVQYDKLKILTGLQTL